MSLIYKVQNNACKIETKEKSVLFQNFQGKELFSFTVISYYPYSSC